MTKTLAECLHALALPPNGKKLIWDTIADRKAKGKPVSARMLLYQQTWERLWAGLPVPEVELNDEDLMTLVAMIDEVDGFVTFTQKEGG